MCVCIHIYTGMHACACVNRSDNVKKLRLAAATYAIKTSTPYRRHQLRQLACETTAINLRTDPMSGGRKSGIRTA